MLAIPADGVPTDTPGKRYGKPVIDLNNPRTNTEPNIPDAEEGVDIGPASAETFSKAITSAKTILWNGPVGVFEFDQFGEGTRVIAQAIAASSAFSLAGGGDTLAAIEKYGVEKGLSYISTGGGAFLEFVEGKVLPAVAMLEARAKEAQQ